MASRKKRKMQSIENCENLNHMNYMYVEKKTQWELNPDSARWHTEKYVILCNLPLEVIEFIYGFFKPVDEDVARDNLDHGILHCTVNFDFHDPVKFISLTKSTIQFEYSGQSLKPSIETRVLVNKHNCSCNVCRNAKLLPVQHD